MGSSVPPSLSHFGILVTASKMGSSWGDPLREF